MSNKFQSVYDRRQLDATNKLISIVESDQFNLDEFVKFYHTSYKKCEYYLYNLALYNNVPHLTNIDYSKLVHTLYNRVWRYV